MNKVKKIIWDNFPFVRKVYSHYITHFYKRLYEKSPRLAAETYYANIHNGKKPDLDNPKTLEEKNIWLALNTDTSMWSVLSDKYEVRNYVKECGLAHILNELYGKWDHIDDIDFSLLPNEFVIKANNSCETVLIVKNKNELDVNEAKKKINSWFKGLPYGYIGYNGHYLHIKPCIIAEKLLHDSKSKDLPIDYKFFCSYGEAFCCAVMQERTVGTHDKRTTFFDSDWNVIYDDNKINRGELLSKPKSYDEMIQYCYRLAKDFALVRVDFYEIDGEPIFGEMTFTSGVDIFTDELNRDLGKYIDLSQERGKFNA